MNFISELKRRNVIRMAGLYMVGAWLLTQVSATVLPLFNAPLWMPRGVVIALAIGFIPAMIFAWIFELTPDGLKRDAEVTPEQSIAPQTARKMERSILVLFAIALAFFGFDKFYLAPKREAALVASTAQAVKAEAISSTQTASSPISSIAVLPFQNKNSDADTEYLSDGLAESLIYRLAQLPNLKVSPSSSIFRYKNVDIDPVKVGTELGVQAVMSGRLVQRGDDLSISVELLDVRNNSLLWGEQYNRKMSELLATQREIAVEITNKLQLKLIGDDAKGITKRYTDSNDAYQLYLRGRYHFAKRTKEDMFKGIEYFQQAIIVDPNFALAYARIAEIYASLPAYPYLSPNEAIPKAKAAAQRALKIDPSLAEAHTFLAYAMAVYDWDWVNAEHEFKRGIELDAKNPAAHFRYGQMYLAPVGRSEDAIAEMKIALETDPLDLNMAGNLAWVYFSARQFDKAVAQGRKTYELDNNFTTARWNYSIALTANSDFDEAFSVNDKALLADPTSQFVLHAAGYTYAKAGRRKEAQAIIDKLLEMRKTEYVISYFIASIYATLGDKENAFKELEKSYSAHDFYMNRLKVDPYWDPLRTDPRYKELLKRMGLPE